MPVTNLAFSHSGSGNGGRDGAGPIQPGRARPSSGRGSGGGWLGGPAWGVKNRGGAAGMAGANAGGGSARLYARRELEEGGGEGKNHWASREDKDGLHGG